MSIKRQVDAIEARISRSVVVDWIRKDGKERLKANETLMALLLKLDAVTVSGVDSGIRVFRRAVIKKAIALLERVDSIATNDPIHTQTLALPHEDNDSADACTSNSEYRDEMIESGHSEDVLNSDESMANTLDNMEDGGDSAEECVEQKVVETCDGQSEIKGGEYNCAAEEMIENSEGDDAPGAELRVDSSLMEEVNEEERCDKTPALSECVQESVDIGHNVENGMEVNEEEVDALDMIVGDGKDAGNDNKKNKELLERMIEDNGKMMKMMSELFERNEGQSRMLNTLTHRLEQVEKVFVCAKMKRKKKRHCS